MTLFHLTDHAHVAIIGQDSVWLDTRDDAYLCLPDAGLRRVNAAAVEIADLDVADALTGQGLVTAISAKCARRDLPRPPLRDVHDFPEMTPVRSSVAPLLAAGLRLYLDGHRGSIADLMAMAQRWPQPHASPSSLAATLAVAKRVNRWLRWAPGSGACLQHAFALTYALRHAGLPATWVIGVQTWPFLAHAWVQAGDVALNDTAERLSGFEPILAM